MLIFNLEKSMKKVANIFYALLAAFVLLSSVVEARTITDMAGRTVNIPDKISRVYVNHQPGVVLMHTIDLDLLCAYAFELLPGEKRIVPEKYHSIPVLGTVGGNNSGNKEVIMAAKPDVAIMFTYVEDMTVNLADDFQKSTGIPVVMAEMTVKKIPEVYRFVGKILDREERCNKLADYCEKILQKSEIICKELEDSKKVKVYYAQGPKGLISSAAGTSHGEIIDMAGGFNVVERNSAADGRIPVNMEQVMIWNPDVILLADRIHSASPTENDPNKLLQSLHDGWKNIKACKNGRVYFVPCIPYNVLDMPPSVNRIIGILWLGDILYPGKFTTDIRKEFAEFYDLFYNYKVTDKELDEFLFKK